MEAKQNSVSNSVLNKKTLSQTLIFLFKNNEKERKSTDTLSSITNIYFFIETKDKYSL